MNQIKNNFPDRQVCVVGLGYVGLTLATTMANAGFRVYGIEINPSICENLRAGEPHFFELGMEEQFARVISEARLTVDTHIPPGCEATVFIITVGTPLGLNGAVRMDMIERATKEVAAHLKDGDMVLARSTIKVGTTRRTIAPILERTGKSFDLAFCPERTQQGHALRELRELPQIVGGVTAQAATRATALFQRLTPTVLRVSDSDTAEMIKLVDNVSRDVTFAFANEMAQACEALGVSVVEVVKAARWAYPRAVVAMPGPVGGPCLTKDSHILIQSLPGKRKQTPITRAARALNESLVRDSVNQLHEFLRSRGNFPSRPTISILGFAFKGYPPTDDLRGSTVIDLIAQLRKLFPKAMLRGFDPMVHPAGIRGLNVKPMSSIAAAFAGADLVVVHNSHTSFKEMPLRQMAGKMRRRGVVYDFWNLFDDSIFRETDKAYLGLGNLRGVSGVTGRKSFRSHRS